MALEEIHLTFAPVTQACTSRLRWDDEANILIATISYTPTSESSAYPLRRQIHDAVGITEPEYTVVVSSVEISLDAEKIPISVELRMNPARWQRAELLPVEAQASQMHILTGYDSNNIASIDVDLAVFWDKPKSILSVCVNKAHRSARWHSMGNHVAFGVTDQSTLAEIRFLDFTLTALPTPEP